MLEEFCRVCGYNRKYAIWLLSRPLSTWRYSQSCDPPLGYLQ